MADVFISHIEEDAKLVQQLAAALEDAGYGTWYHERDAVPGPSYLVQTSQAIEGCHAFLLVISKESLGSHQVTKEVVRAHESRKPFIPLLVDLSHVEFQNRQPEWREAMGAATSIGLPGRRLADVFAGVKRGLQALGIQPSRQPGPGASGTDAGHRLVDHTALRHVNSPPLTSLGSASGLRDEANLLIVGNVQAKADGSTYLDIWRASRIECVPITLIIDVPRQDPRHYDYSILFDLTNGGPFDLRIVDVFVRTLRWQELEQIVRYVPLAGLGETRQFLCIIDKQPRQYRASLDQSGSYLRLRPGELETIALMLTALHEGKYSVQVEVEYSVGGRTGTSVIGPIDDVRFLDRSRIAVLPR